MTFCFVDVVALMDEAKTMNTVGKYNDNIVNLQGVCFDKPDGCKLKNVSTWYHFGSFDKDIKESKYEIAVHF